jgi:antitoxin (DNA-binding transcriptional repressor) of toxin-antitoxin stability system
MKTATLRDLRNNFAKLEAWLAEGEDIQIERRGQPVAVLKSVIGKKPGKMKMPDFAARQKALWGDKVFSQKEVDAMRAYELEGEEG